MHPFPKLALAKTLSLPSALFLVLLLALSSAGWSQTRVVNATIDTSKTGVPISKNIYGQFLEHGGDIVNTGVSMDFVLRSLRERNPASLRVCALLDKAEMAQNRQREVQGRLVHAQIDRQTIEMRPEWF